jgi:hypothetical protein
MSGMSGWRFGNRLTSGIVTGIAALVMYVPGLVIAFVVAVIAMRLFDLSPDEGGDVVAILWNVPAVLLLVVGLATWAPAAWQVRQDRARRVTPADPGPWAAVLDPLAREVRVAGFRDVGWCTRGRDPFLVLVSADGIVAVVGRANPGATGTRPAADGSPAVIQLFSPIVVGRDIAYLMTGHSASLGRRAAIGPAIAQSVPSGDPVAMAAHHRAGAASLVAIGLPVPAVAPEAAPHEIDRFFRQAAGGVVLGLVPWLIARYRSRHAETVTATTRPLDFERAVGAILVLLPRPERRPIAAALRYRRALGHRPRTGPTMALPDRPPEAPPTFWPGARPGPPGPSPGASGGPPPW